MIAAKLCYDHGDNNEDTVVNPYDRMRRAVRVGCPFCSEWIPTPRRMTEVFSPEGALGGRCQCGAVFVVDEIGRAGGLALIDAQTLLCAGDTVAAGRLETGVHVDVETRPYLAMGATARRQRGGPTVWFVKRRDDAAD